MLVKRLLILLISAALLLPSPAMAHQPVELLESDVTAEQGPLLVDGTISFAVRAAFTKSGQVRAFRAGLKAGEALEIQYLIVDKKPENRLKKSKLPKLIVTSPTGEIINIKFTERSPFYEPYGGTNYFYLTRYSSIAEEGIYSFVITSRAKAGITVAVGSLEVPGEVLRETAAS